MPRVENLGPELDAFCRETGNGSSTYDVCAECAEELRDDPHCHNDKLKPFNGDPQGSEGWGGDVEHPPYDELDYTCVICNKPLTDEEDGQ